MKKRRCNPYFLEYVSLVFRHCQITRDISRFETLFFRAIFESVNRMTNLSTASLILFVSTPQMCMCIFYLYVTFLSRPSVSRPLTPRLRTVLIRFRCACLGACARAPPQRAPADSRATSAACSPPRCSRLSRFAAELNAMNAVYGRKEGDAARRFDIQAQHD